MEKISVSIPVKHLPPLIRKQLEEYKKATGEKVEEDGEITIWCYAIKLCGHWYRESDSPLEGETEEMKQLRKKSEIELRNNQYRHSRNIVPTIIW